MTLKLKAIVRRSEAGTIQHALEQLPATGSVRKADDEFVVEATMEGASARELNRASIILNRCCQRESFAGPGIYSRHTPRAVASE